MPVVGRIAFFRLWPHVPPCSTKSAHRMSSGLMSATLLAFMRSGRCFAKLGSGGIALGRGLQPEKFHGAAFVDCSTVLWRRSTVNGCAKLKSRCSLSSSSTSGSKSYLDTGSRMRIVVRRPTSASYALPRAGARLIRITTSCESMSEPSALPFIHPLEPTTAHVRRRGSSSPAGARPRSSSQYLGWSSSGPGKQYGSPAVFWIALIESTRSTFLRIAGVQPRAWYDEPMCVVVEVRNGPPGRANCGWIGQHVVFATCALMPRPAYEPAATIALPWRAAVGVFDSPVCATRVTRV